MSLSRKQQDELSVVWDITEVWNGYLKKLKV